MRSSREKVYRDGNEGGGGDIFITERGGRLEPQGKLEGLVHALVHGQ